jgi:intracellular septation protein
MRRLFDLLPILLFFAILEYAEAHRDWASTIATSLLGYRVVGNTVGVNEAPVMLAVAATVLLTLAQAAWLKWRGWRIDITLWFALGLVVMLGGATLYFHGDSFIKWKPSVLYWAMGLCFWLSPLLFGKNLPRALLGDPLQLPELVWHRLNFAWVAFFAFMGLLNLWVAHAFSTDTWQDFNVFGGIALVMVFTVAQGLYIGRQGRTGTGPSGGAPADSA